MKPTRLLTILSAAMFIVSGANASQVQPLERAHAHNDYEHDRPLFDALDYGFTSVEADIFLVDGALLVAHDFEDVTPTRTLQGLYLDPLRDLVAQNGGSVYGDGTAFNLLIDVKSDAETTWAAVDMVLAGYDDIFTSFSSTGGRTDNAVTAHISGNRDLEAMRDAELRYAGYDGRATDLLTSLLTDTPLDGDLYTMISQNWNSLFTWDGTGEMPEDQELFLAEYVSLAQSQGALVRFWATPDAPGTSRDALWQKLIDYNVDLINTDDLPGLSSYLRANDPTEAAIAPIPLPAGVWLLGAALGALAIARRRTV